MTNFSNRLRRARGSSGFSSLGMTRCAAVLAGILIGGSPIAHAADVLTQHNDNARTGANVGEIVLTRANVAPATFGRLWTLYVDGQISAQPLYVAQLRIDTRANPNTPPVQGTFNAVLLATMHNTVYAYDADAENRLPDGKTKPLWATWLGPPRAGGGEIDMWATNDPEWGILSTPVIDSQKNTVWVVTWNDDGGTLRYRLHALNLKDGAPRQPPVVIGGDPPDPTKPSLFGERSSPIIWELLVLFISIVWVLVQSIVLGNKDPGGSLPQ